MKAFDVPPKDDPRKIWLDRVLRFRVRVSADELTEEELRHPLCWKELKYEHGTYSRALIDPPNTPLDNVPLLVTVSHAKKNQNALKAKTVADLIWTDVELYMYCIASGVALPATELEKSSYVELPINVLSTGSGIAYSAAETSISRPIMYWDRYVSECRRDWISAIQPQIIEKTKGKCWYCGERFVLGALASDRSIPGYKPTPAEKRKKLHIDHQTPLSRGGSDDLENLVPCCATCNSSKGRKTVEEYRAFVASKALAGFPDLTGVQQQELIQSYRFWCERAASGS